MKITRRQLRKIISEAVISETQVAVGLPHDLEGITGDNAIIERVIEIYRRFGELDDWGDKYSKYNMPPDGKFISNMLHNRLRTVARNLNPSNPNYDKIQADIARHRIERLDKAWRLFGKGKPWVRYSTPYSNDESAEEYELDWLENLQLTASGARVWVEDPIYGRHGWKTNEQT